MTETTLDIGVVAAHTGLAPSALRYYEQRGLIASAGRNGLRRVYDADVLDRLALIGCAREAGFGIAEIARFLAAGPGDSDSDSNDNGDLRGRMAAKADELDVLIARLVRMRAGLRHAADCDHEPLVACPEFKALLRR